MSTVWYARKNWRPMSIRKTMSTQRLRRNQGSDHEARPRVGSRKPASNGEKIIV